MLLLVPGHSTDWIGLTQVDGKRLTKKNDLPSFLTYLPKHDFLESDGDPGGPVLCWCSGGCASSFLLVSPQGDEGVQIGQLLGFGDSGRRDQMMKKVQKILLPSLGRILKHHFIVRVQSGGAAYIISKKKE